MISGIINNISALDALGKKMGVTANNIANADSEGFKKSRGVITEGQNNSVEIEISKVESPGPIVSEMIEGEPVEKEMSNVDSEGFKKSRGVITEGQNNSVEIEISRVESPGPIVSEMVEGEVVERELSNVDLTEEIPNTIPIQRNFEANIKVIQTRDEMLGSILDIIG